MNTNSISFNQYPSDNLVDWFEHIHYNMRILKWQLPLVEMLTYAEQGKVSRLCVSAPPQHGKTELVVNTFLSYYMVNNPNDKVIVTAYSESRAVKYGTWIRDILKYYKDDTLFKPTLRQDFKKKNNFMFDEPYNGELIATGSHGAIMGNPANLIIIDDPIKEIQEAQSPTMQEHLRDWYYTTIDTRLRKRYRRHKKALPPLLFVVAQRLNLFDLQGIILEEEPSIDGKTALQKLRSGETIPSDTWVNMNFPSLSLGETEDILGRPKDTPLWSNHRNYEDLVNTKRRIGSYRFNMVYQGTPTALQGTLFLREWFYNPDGTLKCTVPVELVPQHLRWMRTYDLAARFKHTDMNSADEVAGTLTSTDPMMELMYVDGMVNGKFTAHTLLNTLKKTIKTDGYRVTTNIEQEGASQSGLFITQLMEEFSNYNIISHKPVGSKAYRTIELQALAETGRLKFITRDDRSNEWIYKAVDQLIEFDGKDSNARLKKHDDIVDSLSASANHWLQERNRPRI